MSRGVIYVSAASHDWRRARAAMGVIREAGLEVAYDWTPAIEDAIASGARESDLLGEERLSIVDAELAAVRRSHALLFLVPETGGRGCWCEYQHAIDHGVPVVVAGPWRLVSAFTVQSRESCATDEAGVGAAIRLALVRARIDAIMTSAGFVRAERAR